MRWLFIPLFVFSLSACDGGVEDLKSPCVSASQTGEQSPCDRRAPSGQWPT